MQEGGDGMMNDLSRLTLVKEDGDGMMNDLSRLPVVEEGGDGMMSDLSALTVMKKDGDGMMNDLSRLPVVEEGGMNLLAWILLAVFLVCLGLLLLALACILPTRYRVFGKYYPIGRLRNFSGLKVFY